MIKSVNICGIKHPIIECKDEFDCDIHLGQIDYKQCEIKINDFMSYEAKMETIFHEVVHGILTHIGYQELSHDETFVQAFANALFQCCDFKEEK